MLKKWKQRKEQDELVQEHFYTMLEEATTNKEISEILTFMEKYRDLTKKTRISPDTLAVVAGNLFGIMLILNHEKMNVITSKALAFVLRGRI